MDADAIRSLQSLPGVGPSIARDFVDLGILRPEELAGIDPDSLYDDLCTLRGEHIDRCVVYVFRCAHYAVTTDGRLTQLWDTDRWHLDFPAELY